MIRIYIDKQLVFVDLKQRAAWEIARHTTDLQMIKMIEAPQVVKEMIWRMVTAEKMS